MLYSNTDFEKQKLAPCCWFPFSFFIIFNLMCNLPYDNYCEKKAGWLSNLALV